MRKLTDHSPLCLWKKPPLPSASFSFRLEPEQKPRFLVGTYRVCATHCVRVSTFFLTSHPTFSLPPRRGSGREPGEGEVRQAYSAAPALNQAPPVSIAAKSRMRSPNYSGEDMVAPHRKPRFSIRPSDVFGLTISVVY